MRRQATLLTDLKKVRELQSGKELYVFVAYADGDDEPATAAERDAQSAVKNADPGAAAAPAKPDEYQHPARAAGPDAGAAAAKLKRWDVRGRGVAKQRSAVHAADPA